MAPGETSFRELAHILHCFQVAALPQPSRPSVLAQCSTLIQGPLGLLTAGGSTRRRKGILLLNTTKGKPSPPRREGWVLMSYFAGLSIYPLLRAARAGFDRLQLTAVKELETLTSDLGTHSKAYSRGLSTS